MENIEEIFKEKNFNSETLKYIENFLDEFDGIFGKYVSRDEVIRRIKENLNKNIGYFSKDESNDAGTYSSFEKEICLREGMSEEDNKSVIFHEMIHCITTRGLSVGFDEEYITEDLEDNSIMAHHGLTEGFTAYATTIRNQKYGIERNSYPILQQQTKNLIEIIGEDEFWNVAFNNPVKLFDLMEKNRLAEDYGDVEIFLDKFDVIWRYERQILNSKTTLLGRIREDDKEIDTPLADAKEYIIKTFSNALTQREISSPAELMEIYSKIKGYSRQLDINNGFPIYDAFFVQFKHLEEKGIPREEILNGLGDDAKEVLEGKEKLDNFLSLDRYEQLEQIANNPDQVFNEVIYSEFADYCMAEIAKSILTPNLSHATEMYWMLDSGLAKHILENGYNLDSLAIEFLEIDDADEMSFNLYNADGENTNYLGTFGCKDCSFVKYTPIENEEEREWFVAQRPDFKDAAFLKSETGQYILYYGDDKYKYISSQGRVSKLSEYTNYCESPMESQLRKVRSAKKQYDTFSKMGYMEKFAERFKIEMEEHYQEYLKLKSGRLITPIDVEEATKEVNLEEIGETLAKFIESAPKRKKSLEEGINYEPR